MELSYLIFDLHDPIYSPLYDNTHNYVPCQVHEGEIWVGVDEISCLSEELAIRLLLPDPTGQE